MLNCYFNGCLGPAKFVQQKQRQGKLSWRAYFEITGFFLTIIGYENALVHLKGVADYKIPLTWQVQDEDEGPAQFELAPYKSSQRFDSDSEVEDDVEEANELIDEEEDKKYFQTCN